MTFHLCCTWISIAHSVPATSELTSNDQPSSDVETTVFGVRPTRLALQARLLMAPAVLSILGSVDCSPCAYTIEQ